VAGGTLEHVVDRGHPGSRRGPTDDRQGMALEVDLPAGPHPSAAEGRQRRTPPISYRASLRSDMGAGVDDELEQNRAAMHAVFAEDGYAGRIGARLADWGGGWSRVELTVVDEHANFAGLLHGGVTFGLGDAAFAVASNSWGRLSVALSVDVQFLGTVSAGTVLVATAHERHRTKRTGAYLIEVRSPPSGSEDDGELIGSLHALVHRTDRWLLGVDAWSEEWRTTH
jgi:acyl-CoA thioesterase